MKKSTAVASVSVLGMAGATLAAAPAQAAEITEACTSPDEHVTSSTAGEDSWYMECIPQFGLGKVEFSITSDIDFPDEFLPLNDSGVASVAANTGAEADTYFSPDPLPRAAGFLLLDEDSENPRERRYVGEMFFAIDSVHAITGAQLATAGCTGDYTNAYRVDYLPATVTFTQEIDGEEWEYVVTEAPPSLFLGLNFIDNVEPAGLDADAGLCAANHDGNVAEGTDQDVDTDIVRYLHAEETLTPHVNRDPDEAYALLGNFARGTAPAVPVEPETEPAAAPKLPPTGADVTTPIWVASLLFLSGLFAVAVGRRRRNES